MAYLGNSPINRLYSTQAILLAQGQTAVNVTYTPGMCLVFKNGALLDPGTDYTATNGSVITLAKAASTGDVLRVINLSQFAVANALALSGGTLGGPLTGPASAAEGTAGLIALTTTALAQALTDDATALTPKKLAAAFTGSAWNPGSNGFQRLPSQIIIQWGNVGVISAGGTKPVTLPIAYPTAHLVAFAIEAAAAASTTSTDVATGTKTLVGFNILSRNTNGNTSVDWFSIGY